MKQITEAIARLGLNIHAHDEAKTHAEHAQKIDTRHGTCVAKTVLLHDKKGRAFICFLHPDTELSTKLLSSRLGCGKGGVAEAPGALTREVFGSSSVITLSCVMECPYAMGVLMDQELKTEFWVGAAHGSGSIFLDGVHVAQLLEDRSLQTIDFSANPKIDRDNPPDLKSFADALEPLPKEMLEKARERADLDQKQNAQQRTSGKDTKNKDRKSPGHELKAVLDVNALASALIEQITGISGGDAEAQRRVKLDVASQLNQLRNAAYAAGFAAKSVSM